MSALAILENANGATMAAIPQHSTFLNDKLPITPPLLFCAVRSPDNVSSATISTGISELRCQTRLIADLCSVAALATVEKPEY
jgi:hypothetical protein